MSAGPLFDPGLQPERTELAWRRTVLGIGVGSLVSMRLFPAVYGDPLWVIPGVVGVIFAGAVWIAARARYAQANAALRDDSPRRLPGGALLLVVAAFTAIAGLLGLGLALLT